MKEEFLYYIWENRLITDNLFTTQGEKIQVVSPGFRNTDSGPDFHESKIRIGDTMWAGNVEIHVKSSDWKLHGHQNDKAYNNVILHVVYEDDLLDKNQPTLVLNGKFDSTIYDNYSDFIRAKRWIPCEYSIAQIQQFTWLAWLDSVSVERVEQKTTDVEKMFQNNHHDWEATFYQLLLHYFGLKVNNDAFEYLSRLLPQSILMKHADNVTQLEAMLFGCAGMLERNFEDDYPKVLQREYKMLKSKFDLLQMPETYWRFMRMRPNNFPTLRLAQMAQLIHKHGNMFSKILNANTIEQIRSLFDVVTSSYWNTHYVFEKPVELKTKTIGDSTIDILIINAVVPLLFFYGNYHNEQSYCDRSMSFLEALSAENNNVVRGFANHGLKATNALQSQAMLQLFECYCRRRKCLDCRIGKIIMKQSFNQ